jgi:hypothetical protein
MPITEKDLNKLKEIVTEFTLNLLAQKKLTGKFNIDTIILYGSGARHFLGQVSNNRDFDLNVFLRKPNKNDGDVRHLNKQGVIWDAGNYQGKKVEVLYNLLKDKHKNWKEYVLNQNSERWIIIRDKPILVLHPERENLESLT